MAGQHGARTLSLETFAFSSRDVLFGRCVAIHGADTWIENTILFPHPHAALPILGLELLVFRGRMHLIVADLFPLLPRDEGVMDDIAPDFAALGEPAPVPSWATRIFSRSPVFRKPREVSALSAGASAMRQVARRWFELARSRREVPLEERGEAGRRLLDYAVAHAEDEPAGPFLSRAFGQPGERLIREVLFPLDLLSRGLAS
jgi:hypothetical protein